MTPRASGCPCPVRPSAARGLKIDAGTQKRAQQAGVTPTCCIYNAIVRMSTVALVLARCHLSQSLHGPPDVSVSTGHQASEQFVVLALLVRVLELRYRGLELILGLLEDTLNLVELLFGGFGRLYRLEHAQRLPNLGFRIPHLAHRLFHAGHTLLGDKFLGAV